jgi:hypothetical protein
VYGYVEVSMTPEAIRSMLLIPWTMTSGLRWMFDACRVPGLDGKDFSVTSAKEGDSGDSGTVVFIRNGKFWKVDATIDGRLLSTSEWEQ